MGKQEDNYEVIKLVKQSEKSTVHLVRKKGETQLLIRKRLAGRHPVYEKLQECPHPYLPKLYEVELSDDTTTVIEEYIEGETPGDEGLTQSQFKRIVRELCDVLEFLHRQGILHRDIKPTNIILAKDGHIRLIDFDAARMMNEEKEQDTVLLGTRGYAPPEQYGFAQTDERADIYALGVMLTNILGENRLKARYRRILSKCTNLDPDKRYKTARQLKRAFFGLRRRNVCIVAAVFLCVLLCSVIAGQKISREPMPSEEADLIVLPAPKEPHWDQNTGIAVWGNVPESGVGSDVQYDWKLYRCDTPTPPDPNQEEGGKEGSMRGRGGKELFNLHLACELGDNGYYYFAVRSVGDGVTYADSTYVLSDYFEYTGADAPRLPSPEDLAWILREDEGERVYFASFSNWDDYEDKDTLQVFVYDEEGNSVFLYYTSKAALLERGEPGLKVPAEYVTQRGKSYRFAIQVTSSQPNRYRASPEVFPWPVQEEYLSPWLDIQSL